MLALERKFFHAFKNELKKESQIYFDHLFKEALEFQDLKLSKLRYMKNYLIYINSALYELTYEKPCCKKSIYINRRRFNLNLEIETDLEGLKSLGYKIIDFYLDSIGKLCKELNPIIGQAIRFIHENLDSRLTLKDISKDLNISSNYLSCLFSESLNIGFPEFINKARVQKAKILLETTNLSLLHIALDCGFSSQSYFCYVFKDLEKITPTQYRRRSNKTLVAI